MRNRFTRSLSLLGLVIVLAAAAVTCSQAPAPSSAPSQAAPPASQVAPAAKAEAPKPAAPAPAAAPKAEAPQPSKPAAAGDKTVVIGLSFDARFLDPARSWGSQNNMFGKAAYNTLVSLATGSMDKIVPDLAEKWDVSSDAKVFTFYLRPNVKFHSGNPLTAQDVKWSMDRAIGLKAGPSFLMETIKTIEAKDDRTVVATLKDSDPAFLSKATSFVFAVLDSKTVAARGGDASPQANTKDQSANWLEENSAGTGPFVLKSHTKGQQLVLEKFPGAWQGNAKIDRVIYKNFPETASLKMALEVGDVDIAVSLSSDLAKSLASNANVKIVSGLGRNLFWLAGHMDPKNGGPVSNLNVMQAIRYAIDYQGLKDLAGGDAVVPPSAVQVGLTGAWDESKATKRDVNKAKALLKDAGYPNGFQIDLYYPTKFIRGGIDFDILAQKIYADLAEVGIKATLKPTDLQTMLQQYSTKDSKMPFVLWVRGMQYLDINNYLANFSGGEYALWSGWTDDRTDPAILKVRDSVAKEINAQKRIEDWNQIQQYLMDKGPYVSLVQPGERVGIRKNIGNYVFDPLWFVNPFLITKD